MEGAKSIQEAEMKEIQSKVTAQGPNSQERTRTLSQEGSRIAPKGPKDPPRTTQDQRAELPPKPVSKDNTTVRSNIERDFREKPTRPASMDGIYKAAKDEVPTAGIVVSDDFLNIGRPMPVHMRPEGDGSHVKKEGTGLLARLTGPRRPDPREWPPDAISELQRRDEIYQSMKAYIDRLEERIQSQDQEISALNTALADTEHKLDLTRQDLNASRAFVSSEGTADAQHLIRSLREINSAIDDFAFRLMQEVLPDIATSKPVTKGGLEALGKAYSGAHRISAFINLAYQQKATVGDFIHPFICYTFCARLVDLVFQPFVPGLPRDESEIFQAIYSLVHQNEPQERSARWRAITYSHAHRQRDDKIFCSRAADDLLEKLTDAINPLLEHESITFDQLKADLGDVAKGIFEDAIKLQDKARSGYMSFDYNPFLPPVDQAFHPMYMETAQEVRQGGRGKASQAVLVVGLGMQAWKSVVKEDKSMGKDVSIAVKANVICGNWNPNA